MLIVPQVDLVTSRRCHGRSPLSGPSAACLKTSCQRNQGTVPGHVWVNVARIRTSGKSMEKFGQSMDTYGKVWKNGIVRWVSIHSTPYLSLLSIIYPQKKMNISPLICFSCAMYDIIWLYIGSFFVVMFMLSFHLSNTFHPSKRRSMDWLKGKS